MKIIGILAKKLDCGVDFIKAQQNKENIIVD